MSEFRIEVLSRKAPRARKRKGKDERLVSDEKNYSFVLGTAILFWWLVKPRRPTWVVGTLAFVIIAYGTPHLLVTYNCNGVGTPLQRCTACRYFGMQGMTSQLGPNWDCPIVAMLPVNWSALLGLLGNG